VQGYLPTVTFDVSAADYARFMGRYADPLAELFVDLVLDSGGLGPDDHVLDVGCGPGTVTAVLADRLGVDRVAAVDPSPTLVAAARERFPAADVREAVAESLPFEDGAFGVAVSQLVVPFMADPLQGLAEMGRVVRAGGLVAVCAWDVAEGPIATYWRVADQLDPGAARAVDLPGAREGQLAAMMPAAISDTRSTTLTVEVEIATFEEWWSPFAFGIGPAGEYFVSLGPDQQAALREACKAVLSAEPILISGTARAAVGRRG
jgi:SAM-dependent methyltransferase